MSWKEKFDKAVSSVMDRSPRETLESIAGAAKSAGSRAREAGYRATHAGSEARYVKAMLEVDGSLVTVNEETYNELLNNAEANIESAQTGLVSLSESGRATGYELSILEEGLYGAIAEREVLLDSYVTAHRMADLGTDAREAYDRLSDQVKTSAKKRWGKVKEGLKTMVG